MVAAMVTVTPGAGETRRLLRADAHQRQPGRGHRTRSAADRHGGRFGRPGSVRPQREHLRREPRPAERAAEGARQARGGHRPGAGRARRRRHARDGQRRPRADYRRRRLPGRVLEPGVHRYQGAQGRHRAVRRQPGRRVSQGESQAPRGRQHVDRQARQRRRIPQRGRTPLSQERQVREERRGRCRATEIGRRWSICSRNTGSNTTSTTC